MKTIITDNIVLGDVLRWINKSKSIDSLNKIRVKSKKRIESIKSENEYNPLEKISIKKKRAILKPLLIYSKSTQLTGSGGSEQ